MITQAGGNGKQVSKIIVWNYFNFGFSPIWIKWENLFVQICPLPPVKKVAAAQNSLKKNIGREQEGLEKFCQALKSVRRKAVAGWEN